MNTSTKPTLDEAVAAAKKLPEAAQDIIAREILDLTVEAEQLPPTRTAEEQAIIQERMSQPRTYVPRERIDALLNKYKRAV